MEMLAQLDLFEEYTEKDEQQIQIDLIKDSLRRTQKRFFAQNKELVTMMIKLEKEIGALNKRLNILNQGMVKEYD